MFSIIILSIISLSFLMLLKLSFEARIKFQQTKGERLTKEFDNLNDLKKRLDCDNAQLNQVFANILGLYELTKDICKHLEEEKAFLAFNQSLKKYISIGDCRYIKDSADLLKYKNHTIIPLSVESDQIVGYLAVDRILEADKEKFNILVQQFLIGLRRALLYQKVQGMTITDSLTQVYCRRYFLERFNEEVKRSKKNKLHLSFLMIDIDNFKQFNDRYGHLVGDAILRSVAKTLIDAIRQIDFIGRYGGEELSIVMAETDHEQAKFAAERIRQAIADMTIKVYDEELKITVSIGVATYPDNAANMQELIEMADQALYLAKETGKNKVCFCPT